ncbi:MAG: glutathione-disulfide reductase [Alphaproteobacteria bacterium]|nr:glutathione-disulfide reductase [Alphaproteobacteria bacterium]
MTSYDFDLFTIGAGSGGVRATRIAAGFGARAAVAEEYRAGGTCVIRGCVPKKLMVYGSRIGFDIEDARGFGWTHPDTTHDWATLIRAKDQEIGRLEGLYRKGLEGAGATIIDDRAELVGPHEIRLKTADRIVTAKTILIAVGASPHLPQEVAGIEHAITSNEVFHLRDRPAHIVIVGAGYIALEFACIFRGYGSEVTVVHYGPEILRGFDREGAAHLHQELAKRGIRFIMDATVVGIRREGQMRDIGLSTGEVLQAGEIMFATGRWPNTRGLGLEAAGLDCNAKGAIPVDRFSQTQVPHIYAVGDVTDRANLTPVAIREGHAFAETVFNNNPIAVDHADIPTAIFTTPEFASVGLTEEQARHRHADIHIYRAKYRPMRATISGRDEQTLMKLIVDGADNRVLGVHMVGADAGEIIQMAAIPVKMKCTKADFDAAIALHPSAAEEFVLMRTRAS